MTLLALFVFGAVLLGLTQAFIKATVIGALSVFFGLTGFYLVVDNSPDDIAAQMELMATSVTHASQKAAFTMGQHFGTLTTGAGPLEPTAGFAPTLELEVGLARHTAPTKANQYGPNGQLTRN